MVKAVLATKIGDWRETLQLTELPALPDVPPPGTLKIRVSACGMGFPDLLQSADKYQTKAEPPFVPVQYAVGEIVAIGEGAASGDDFSYDGVFKVGDRVVGNAAEDSEGHMRGGLAEEALVRGDAANLVPSFMSDAVVLSMHENYWDTHHGVAVCGEVGPGDTLVVLGASGACGLAAIDLGKALGATVVACASSEEKLEACAAQGADVLVNYGTANDYDEFVATLREADLYGKYSCVFDTVGGRYAEAAFRAMAPEGRYVVFGFAAGGVDPASAFPNFPTNIMLMKGQRILGSMGSSRGPAIREMFEMVQDGRLNPGVASGDYTLDNFQQAYGDVEERKAIGKIIIKCGGGGGAKL